MTALLIIAAVVGGLIAWTVLALAVGIGVGRSVRLADEAAPIRVPDDPSSLTDTR